MIRDLRLALRLVRGGGTAEASRLVLMAVGLALTVTAVLLVAAVPGILGHHDDVLRGRAPVSLEDQAGGPTSPTSVAVSRGSWRGNPLTRVFVSSTDPAATVPPGIDRLPRPGEQLLSPAARALLESDHDVQALLPARTVGEISSAGLTGPDELVAYLGVPSSQNPGARAVQRWGLPAGAEVDGTGQFRWLGLELGVLILPSLGVFLAACSQLAAATRRRRYAALALVGASRRTVARIATVEVALAAVGGTVLGVAAHAVLNPWLGRSGVLGFTWFTEQGHLDVLGVAALLVLGALSARGAGVHSSRRAARSALHERRDPSARGESWWRVLPLVAGTGLLLPLLPWAGGYRGQVMEVCLLAGTALVVGGLFLTASDLSAGAGSVLARSRLPLGIRLGASRLRSNGTSGTSVLGLGLLILVGTIGSGIAASALASASSTTGPITVHLYANEVAPEARSQVIALGKENGGDALLHSAVRPDLNGEPVRPADAAWQLRNVGVSVLVADCDRLRLHLAAAFPRCRPGHWYRVLHPGADFTLPAGVSIPFATPAGTVRITAPAATVAAPGGSGGRPGEPALAYSGSEPPGGWPDDAVFFFRVAPGLTSLDAFSTALARLAPTSSASSSLDLSTISAARAHQAALGFGTRTGFGIGVLAALIAWTDRLRERRRANATLVALGTGRRTLRSAQLTEAVIPMATVALLASAIAWLVVNAFAGVDVARPLWSAHPLLVAGPLAVLSIVVAAAASLPLTGLDLTAEELRHE